MRGLKGKILFIAFLSATFCYSQEKQGHFNKNAWSIGPNLSADVCYRKLINNSDSASSQMVIDSRNSREHPKMSYTLGINTQYGISDHWEFECGLQFAKRGYQGESSGFNPMDPIIIMYNYKYLDIPLRLNYIAGNGPWHINACLGMIPQLFIVENVKMRSLSNSQSSKSNSNFNYHLLQLSGMGGVGIQRNRGRKVLRVELLGKYGLTNIISTPVTAKLWSIGFNFAFFYKLT